MNSTLALLLATTDPSVSYSPSTNAAASPGGLLFTVLTIIGLWVTFKKAGLHGWAAIIPFYNAYTLVKLSGRNGWLFLLFIIPLVNIVFAIIVALGVGRVFGKGGVFSFFLLFLLPFIGYLILGFGSAQPNRNTKGY